MIQRTPRKIRVEDLPATPVQQVKDVTVAPVQDAEHPNDHLPGLWRTRFVETHSYTQCLYKVSASGGALGHLA